MNKPLIISDSNFKSLRIKKQIIKIIKKEKIKKPSVIIVIGGDGFMLQTLKKNKKRRTHLFSSKMLKNDDQGTNFAKRVKTSQTNKNTKNKYIYTFY